MMRRVATGRDNWELGTIADRIQPKVPSLQINSRPYVQAINDLLIVSHKNLSTNKELHIGFTTIKNCHDEVDSVQGNRFIAIVDIECWIWRFKTALEGHAHRHRSVLCSEFKGLFDILNWKPIKVRLECFIVRFRTGNGAWTQGRDISGSRMHVVSSRLNCA